MKVRKLSRLVELYLAWAGHRLQGSTVAGYRAELARIMSALGTDWVGGIELGAIERYVSARRAAGVSARSVNLDVGSLVRVLDWAAGGGPMGRLIAANPLKAWRRLPEGYDGECRRVLTRSEARMLVEHEHKRSLRALGECRNGEMWQVLLLTGMRPSELVALTWLDVDLEAGSIRIRKGKTKRSARSLPLPESLAVRWARRRRSRGLIYGVGATRYALRNVRRRFACCVLAAGLEPDGLQPYTLRRTFATWHIQAGTPPNVLMKLMGHASLRVTLGIYAQVLHGDSIDAARRMDRWWETARPESNPQLPGGRCVATEAGEAGEGGKE